MKSCRLIYNVILNCGFSILPSKTIDNCFVRGSRVERSERARMLSVKRYSADALNKPRQFQKRNVIPKKSCDPEINLG